MAQVINTNIASLNAQRNLNRSQGALHTSLQRLSSGMRINSAKDDAAGLAISERFTAQVRGLNQAVRNSNDGISLAQTAEGALGEVTNNLQRIRELAIQSANATNSSSDRAAMQQEVTALIDEIDRVASQTNFNGVSLLDGSFSAQEFQVGANVGETIAVSSIVNATSEGLGLNNGNAIVTGSAAVNGAISAGGLSINGVEIEATSADAVAIAEAITNSVDNVSATAANSVADLGQWSAVDGTTATPNVSISFTIDGTTVTIDNASSGTDISSAEVISGLEAVFDTNQYSFEVNGDGDFLVTKADGSNLAVDVSTTATGGGVTNADVDAYGTITINSYGANLVVAGDDAGNLGFAAETTAASTNADGITTVAGANAMIAAVDAALDSVNGSRATLGAVQNRFESVVNSLQTSVESLSAARSRIQDADFASETAQMTKAQILQQAGTAMLAQANSLPQNVLSLLG